LHALCLELASADKNPHSRRLAGLILKNALDAKDESRKQQRIQQWLALDAAAKSQIKAGVRWSFLLVVLLLPLLRNRNFLTSSFLSSRIGGKDSR
jgi:importin subunit beta-1